MIGIDGHVSFLPPKKKRPKPTKNSVCLTPPRLRVAADCLEPGVQRNGMVLMVECMHRTDKIHG